MSSVTLADIDRSYNRLMENVDNHIARLTAIEHQLDMELSLMAEARVEVEYPVTESDSDGDDDDVSDYYTPLEIVRGRVFGDNPRWEIPRIRWGDVHEYVGDENSVRSDSTVLNNYTPYDLSDSDDDSDTETVILEWDDPCRSPELRIMYRDIDRADT